MATKQEKQEMVIVDKGIIEMVMTLMATRDEGKHWRKRGEDITKELTTLLKPYLDEFPDGSVSFTLPDVLLQLQVSRRQSRKIDAMKLLEKGVSLEVIEYATIVTPSQTLTPKPMTDTNAYEGVSE